MGDYLVASTYRNSGATNYALWFKAEKAITPKLHELAAIELCKVMYSACFRSPKNGSLPFRRALNDLLFESIAEADLPLLLHIAEATRNFTDFKREERLFARMRELVAAQPPSAGQLAACIWTAGHCKLPHYNIKYRRRDIDERRKRARSNLEPLIALLDVPQCSVDQLIKVMLALYKTGLDNFRPELRLVEQRVVR